MTPIPSRGPALLLRVVLLIGVLIVLTWGGYMIREALDVKITPTNGPQMYRVILLATLVYIGLLALPFVPGAEIGIMMFVVVGPAIAPLLYVATVIALMLAYSVGRFVPVSVLERLLSALYLQRAAVLVARAAPLSQEERLAMFMGPEPNRYVSFALTYRYLAMALAVNAPGNTIIGGGGGIMMIAGLSRVFSPLSTFLTVAIAVAPVPLVVGFLGLYVQ